MKALALLRDTARDALLLWKLAPWIPLIAVLTEFLQHVAEVRMGMFASLDAFRALSNAPERWFWGYGKMAGFTLAWLLATWFWARRQGAGPLWRKAAIAFGYNLAAMIPAEGAKRLLGGQAGEVASMLVSLATLPVLVLLIGALLGDATMNLKRAFTAGWLKLVGMVVLSGIGFAVLQFVHMQDHMLAMGRPLPVVWALMVWDALVVGMIASWLGAGLIRGYGMPRS